MMDSVMRPGQFIRIGLMSSVLDLGGCIGFNVQERPAPVPVDEPVADAAQQLVVIINSEPVDPAPPRGFAVVVDDEVRAWIPESRSYTRMPVSPGDHKVRISRPEFEFELALAIPLIARYDFGAQEIVHCVSGHSCALSTWVSYARASKVTPLKVVPEGSLTVQLEGLTLVPPG